MKLSSTVVGFGCGTFASVSAFAPLHPAHHVQSHKPISSSSPSCPSSPSTSSCLSVASYGTNMNMNTNTISLDEWTQRDVYGMEEWATNYGVQKYDGVELYTADGEDWQLITNSYIPAGTSVLFVPADIVLSSDATAAEFGGSLEAAENALVALDQGTARRLPLFRLMVKILAEYERGEESPWFPWLNSLPRRFYNGVSMTDACFECLPPYAAILSMNERNTYSRFVNAIRKGFVPLDPSTINDDRVVKWAYNVALTRFHEIWEPTRQKLIAPMADMFNHDTNPNVEITVDPQGNFLVNTIADVQPGSPLTISLGDPTNPTPLFAQYGFLYDDCKTIFCKAIHLEEQIQDLGYDFKDLLFQTETGEIAPKVWDIFLYKILRDNDPNAADQFYVACKTNDEDTKQQYHDYYFQYTLQDLKNHVYSILGEVDQLTMKAQSYDLETHPRVPVIVAHNNLVRDTFTMTRQLLEAMG
ncbi:hypothetical protein ACHAXS_006117 [Conticribra weissflogii]